MCSACRGEGQDKRENKHAIARKDGGQTAHDEYSLDDRLLGWEKSSASCGSRPTTQPARGRCAVVYRSQQGAAAGEARLRVWTVLRRDDSLPAACKHDPRHPRPFRPQPHAHIRHSEDSEPRRPQSQARRSVDCARHLHQSRAKQASLHTRLPRQALPVHAAHGLLAGAPSPHRQSLTRPDSLCASTAPLQDAGSVSPQETFPPTFRRNRASGCTVMARLPPRRCSIRGGGRAVAAFICATCCGVGYRGLPMAR